MTHSDLESGTDGMVKIIFSKGMTVRTRMPVPAECREHGFTSGMPVLAVRGTDGKERLFAADRTEVISE
jgi:hypothetical protein